MNTFRKNLLKLPNKTFFVSYNSQKYIVTKQTLLENKLIKLYAKGLKNGDIVSANYYVFIKNGLLKPCEMTPKKVIDFVNNLNINK